MSKINSILEGLDSARESYVVEGKVKCPECNSSDIDEWEKGIYYCNRCGHEFDDKDLEKLKKNKI